MNTIKLIVKGSKCNLVIKGDSFKEVLQEYESNREKIDELVGSYTTESETSEQRKPTRASTGATIQDRITYLINDNYFKTPRTAKDVKEALKQSGFTYSIEHISIGLVRLVRKRALRRVAQEKDEKTVYVYTNP